MDFLTSTILSGILYDEFKNGLALTVHSLKEKLQGWLFDDALIQVLIDKLEPLQLDDLGERAIERKLNEASEIQELLKHFKADQNTKIGTVTQIHHGSGDNVVGNKNVYK